MGSAYLRLFNQIRETCGVEEIGDLCMTENFESQLLCDFPRTERFIDFANRIRTFHMRLVDSGMGYLVMAVEESDDDDAYEFQEFSVSLGEAVAVLRKRISKVLSVQNLSEVEGCLSLAHDRTHGRIVQGGVLIDRRFLTYEQFGELLEACEGFQFDLKVVETSDELE